MEPWEEEAELAEIGGEYYEGYKVGRRHEADDFRLQRNRLSGSVRSAFLFGSVVGVVLGLILAHLAL